LIILKLCTSKYGLSAVSLSCSLGQMKGLCAVYCTALSWGRSCRPKHSDHSRTQCVSPVYMEPLVCTLHYPVIMCTPMSNGQLPETKAVPCLSGLLMTQTTVHARTPSGLLVIQTTVHARIPSVLVDRSSAVPYILLNAYFW
jgi:hypothetical protein